MLNTGVETTERMAGILESRGRLGCGVCASMKVEVDKFTNVAGDCFGGEFEFTIEADLDVDVGEDEGGEGEGDGRFEQHSGVKLEQEFEGFIEDG